MKICETNFDFRPSIKERVVSSLGTFAPPGATLLYSNPPRVVAAEAVGEEIAKFRFLLPHEALLWQLAFHKQVAHRADSRGGRDLDRAHQTVADGLAVDLLRVAFLRQMPVHPARNRDEDQHH